MNLRASTIVMTLFLAANCLVNAAAQDDHRAGAQPVLVVQHPIAVLQARPDAVYVVLAGLRRADHGDTAIHPVMMLGWGRIGADGVVALALPACDLAQMEAAGVVLQAAVLAEGEPILLSDAVALRQPTDAAEIDRNGTVGPATLGGPRFFGRSGPMTLGAPRFGRAISSADGEVGSGSGTVGPATLGAPRFSR